MNESVKLARSNFDMEFKHVLNCCVWELWPWNFAAQFSCSSNLPLSTWIRKHFEASHFGLHACLFCLALNYAYMWESKGPLVNRWCCFLLGVMHVELPTVKCWQGIIMMAQLVTHQEESTYSYLLRAEERKAIWSYLKQRTHMWKLYHAWSPWAKSRVYIRWHFQRMESLYLFNNGHSLLMQLLRVNHTTLNFWKQKNWRFSSLNYIKNWHSRFLDIPGRNIFNPIHTYP